MILLSMIVILLVGGLLAWGAGRWSALASRWISLIAVSTDFVIGFIVWIDRLQAGQMYTYPRFAFKHAGNLPGHIGGI